MSRDGLPLAALALIAVALLLAACSNPAASTAGSNDATGSSAHEQALKFATCMRANGVAAFPDPDATGTLTIETVANGTSIDTDSPQFQRAITACKDLEPAGFTGRTRSPEQQQAALKFAQCIRDHGVADFPDPAVDEPLIDTRRIPSTDTPDGMTILHTAMQTCSTYARAAGVSRGK